MRDKPYTHEQWKADMLKLFGVHPRTNKNKVTGKAMRPWLFTVRDQARDCLITTRNNFEAQYARGRLRDDEIQRLEWMRTLEPDTFTDADVKARYPSSNWFELVCDSCGRKVDRVVQMGMDSGIDTAPSNLCRDCILDALKLFDEHDKKYGQ